MRFRTWTRPLPGAGWLLAIFTAASTVAAVPLLSGRTQADEKGEIELAIMGRPPQHPPHLADVLGPHPYVIIAPADHPLAGKAEVTADELLGETFLTREEGSGTRILTTRYLDRIGEGRPYRSIEMGTDETIKQAVIAGLGVALISGHTVGPELEAGRLVVAVALLPWIVMRVAEFAAEMFQLM